MIGAELELWLGWLASRGLIELAIKNQDHGLSLANGPLERRAAQPI